MDGSIRNVAVKTVQTPGPSNRIRSERDREFGPDRVETPRTSSPDRPTTRPIPGPTSAPTTRSTAYRSGPDWTAAERTIDYRAEPWWDQWARWLRRVGSIHRVRWFGRYVEVEYTGPTGEKLRGIVLSRSRPGPFETSGTWTRTERLTRDPWPVWYRDIAVEESNE